MPKDVRQLNIFYPAIYKKNETHPIGKINIPDLRS